MTSKTLFFALFVMLGSVLLAQPANLPPALRAAVQSGNTSAVTQAINTLSGGNPTQAAALAAQVAAAAEAMMATNPQAALNAASAAVGVISSQAVMQAAPQQALQVATIAARISISPAAQQAAPQAVANLATAAVQVATNPAIYQSSPAAAIQVMANAYTATSSPAVLAVAPSAQQQVAQALTAVSQSNPTNAAQINSILTSSRSPRTNTQLNTSQVNNSANATPPVDPSARNVSGS